MKIIFDTNMLFITQLLKDKLPNRLEDFLNKCRVDNHEVIIPRTTLLEFNRHQKKYLQTEINELNGAVKKLARYNIFPKELISSDLVKSSDLILLIDNLGITCKVEEPTLNDFNIAHRKACTRENPHPPDIKSDEMRDLVIWAMALRIASQNNGAILMSKDVVHVHHRGDIEAKKHQLIRCNSFERGLESLSIDTVSAKKIKVLVDNVLDDMIKHDGLPIMEGGHVLSVKKPVFYDTSQGYSVVTCNIEFASGDGKNIKSFFKMKYVDNLPFLLEFSNIAGVDDKVEDVTIKLTSPELPKPDYDSKLNDLKKIIEG